MNWLFWVMLIFISLMMLRGGRRGFARSIVSMLSLVLVMLLASWINPYVSDFLKEKTPVYETVKERCGEILQEQAVSGAEGQLAEIQEELSRNQQIQAINNLPVPGTIREALNENNNSEIYDFFGVSSFADYIAAYIANYIVHGISFLLSVLLASLIIRIILSALELLTDLPVIGFLNTALGMLLGGIQALLWIGLFFLFVTLISRTSAGQILVEQIDGNALLSFAYENNILLQIITYIF